ncbi:MAG: oxidoreductase [Saccharothrix sp.]|nr:oxidoreductase [Saccharothrix sp.]
MSLVVRGVFWIGVYLAVVAGPLLFALIDAPTGRDFWTEFSVALGFIGLSMMGMQFALVARFHSVAAPFGEDAVVQFHRQMAYVATAFVLAHPVILFIADTDLLSLLNFVEAPWRARFAAVSVVLLAAVMVTSVWKSRLRLSYETWQLLHAVLSTLAVVTALVHMILVDHYLDSLWKQLLWTAMTVAFLGLLLRVRLLRPLRRRRRPWEITSVTPQPGNVSTLTLRPVGHDGFDFEPGQFGWLFVNRSPYALTSHPFSFSGSAERDDNTVEMSIKAAGDFTRSVHAIAPGTRAYLDGPHGVFTIDRNEGPGFVLIGGGIGITPLLSMLRTARDRDDPRPFVLFYANRRFEDAAFTRELVELEARLNLEVVHVVQDPPEGWTGEVGFVSQDLLRRRLPTRFTRMQYFVCGPPPMMDALEDALSALGVPADRIHSERLSFVS